MNARTNIAHTPASLAVVATGAAVLLAGSVARADLIYGDGVSKPITTRASNGHAQVFYEYDWFEWTIVGTTVDLNVRNDADAAIHDLSGAWASASTFHQSSFRSDHMNFVLSAYAGHRQMGLPADAHTSIDTWFFATTSTPYWLNLDGSRANLSLTLENGQDAGVLHKAGDGTYLSATGFLAPGWYHLRFELDDVADGIDSGWGISGQIGIPAPGSLTLLMLGGLLATRRAR